MLLAVLLLASGFASAQEHTVSLTGGWTRPPNAPMEMCSPTYGVDLAASWRTLHEDSHRARCEVGVKANFAYIPNDVAGQRFGLSGYVTTPFPALDRWLAPCSLSLQIGTGLGIYTKPKELTGDERNGFIGSFVNCVLDMGPVLVVPIKDNALVIGAKFVHNSNGYLKKPNVGLNYLQGELGWRFSPRMGSHKADADTLWMRSLYDARTAPFVLLAPGFTVPRDSRATNDIFYPAYTFLMGWRYAYQHCRSIGLALDLAYNFADNYANDLEGAENPFPMFVGLSALHETHWGPVSLRLGLGYYVWESFPDSRLYERVGVFYHFGKEARHALGISIKANSTHADFIEWSYCFDLL